MNREKKRKRERKDNREETEKGCEKVREWSASKQIPSITIDKCFSFFRPQGEIIHKLRNVRSIWIQSQNVKWEKGAIECARSDVIKVWSVNSPPIIRLQKANLKNPFLSNDQIIIAPTIRHSCGQFHQHFTSSFWAIFLAPKKYKPTI